jgi:hypothetical protein
MKILRYSFFSISEMPTLVSGTMLEKDVNMQYHG